MKNSTEKKNCVRKRETVLVCDIIGSAVKHGNVSCNISFFLRGNKDFKVEDY